MVNCFFFVYFYINTAKINKFHIKLVNIVDFLFSSLLYFYRVNFNKTDLVQQPNQFKQSSINRLN